MSDIFDRIQPDTSDKVQSEKGDIFDRVKLDTSTLEAASLAPEKFAGMMKEQVGGFVNFIGQTAERYTKEFSAPESMGEKGIESGIKPEELSKLGTSITKSGKEDIKHTEDKFEGKKLTSGQEFALDASTNIAQNLVTLSLSLVNPAVGLTSFGILAGGGEFNKMQEAGYSYETSTAAAAVVGAAEVGTEFLSLGKWAFKAMKPMSRLASTLGHETWTEEVNTLITSAVDIVTTDYEKVKNMDWKERALYLGKRMVDTAVMTAITVPFLAGGAHAGNKLISIFSKNSTKNTSNDIKIEQLKENIAKQDVPAILRNVEDLLKNDVGNAKVKDGLIREYDKLTQEKIIEKAKEQKVEEQKVTPPQKEAQEQQPLPAAEPLPTQMKPTIISRNITEGGKVDEAAGYRGVPAGGYHTTDTTYGSEKTGTTRWEAVNRSTKPLIWEGAEAQAIRDKIGYKADYINEGEVPPVELNQKLNKAIIEAGYDSIVVEGGKEIGLMKPPKQYFSTKQTYKGSKQNLSHEQNQVIIGNQAGQDVGRVVFNKEGQVLNPEEVKLSDMTADLEFYAKEKFGIDKLHGVVQEMNRTQEVKPEASPVLTESVTKPHFEEPSQVDKSKERLLRKLEEYTPKEITDMKKYVGSLKLDWNKFDKTPANLDKAYKEATVFGYMKEGGVIEQPEKQVEQPDKFYEVSKEEMDKRTLQEEERKALEDDESGAINLEKIGKVPKNIYDRLIDIKKKLADLDAPDSVIEGALKGVNLQNQIHNARMIRWMGKLLPQDFVMRHPVARKVWESAMKFTEMNEVYRYKMIQKKLLPLLKSIPSNIKADLADYVEGKKVVPVEAQVHVKAIKDYLEFMHKFAKSQGIELGHLSDYLPHFFERFTVKIKGVGLEESSDGYEHRDFYKSMEEAIEKAKELEKQGYAIEYVGPTFTPDIYDIRVSNKKMARLIIELKDDMTMTWGEIKSKLSEAGIKGLPKNYFTSFTEKRVTNNPNYIKDIDTILELYTHKIIRKITVNEFRSEVQKDIESLQSSELKQNLNYYVDSVIYTPSAVAKMTADVLSFMGFNVDEFQVRSAVGTIAGFQYVWDLGVMASSAISNGSQVAINTGSLVGFSNVLFASKQSMQVLYHMKTGKGKVNKALVHEIENQGIIEEAISQVEYANMSQKAIHYPLIMFTTMEQFNRVTSYIAAKSYIEKKGKPTGLKILDILQVPRTARVRELSGKKFEIAFAKELVNHTQYRSEAFNSPDLLNTPIAGIVAPYQKFLINYTVFQYKLVAALPGGDAKKEAIAALLRFLGISLILAGSKANFLTQILGKISNEASKIAFGQSIYDTKLANIPVGEILESGFPSFGGFDLSNAISVTNPFSSTFYNKEKSIFQKVAGGVIPRMAEASYALAKGDMNTVYRLTTPRFVKKFQQGYEIFATNEYRDSTGSLIADNIPLQEGLKSIAGLTPKVVMEEYRRKEANDKQIEWYNTEVIARIDNWANKIQQGKTDQADVIINQLVNILEETAKKLETAKPGKHEDDLMKRMEMISGALDSDKLFDEAIEKKSVSSMLRERRKAFQPEAISNYIKSQE